MDNLKKLIRLSLCSCLALVAACGDTGEPPPADDGPLCPTSTAERIKWLNELPCPTAFSVLSTKPTTAIFANTSLVKFVIDLEDESTTYFIDGRSYNLHYTFCSRELDDAGFSRVGTHAEFNEEQYRRQERRFLLGTLTYFGDHNLVALSFATGDLISNAQIRFAFEHIKKVVYFGDIMKYRPVSTYHEEAARSGALGDLPLIYSEELYAGISYQPLNPGRAFGYVRLIGDGSVAEARPTDVVVLTEAPNDIRPVAAVITQRFQTPLSHVNILSKNRGTPNMGLVDALADPRLTELQDQLVELTVTQQSWSIRPASLADAEAHWAEIRPKETFLPRLDLTERRLVDLEDVDATALPSIGAKAANMAEMTEIDGITLPDTPFAIPFVYYRDHLERNHLDVRVDAMLEDPRFLEDPVWRDVELAALRESIKTAPFNPVLLGQLHAQVQRRFDQRKVRFRSSTNSEDLPNFNGAGLYRSYAARLSGDPRLPEDAVRRVWASLWTDEAVAEREFYRIDHSTVAMAVLVHPSFVDETANGVALTTNIFNPRLPGYFVNVQEGEASVTNPGPGEVPDQFIVYTWRTGPEVEYLSYSTLTEDGQPVLEHHQVVELHDALALIHGHFMSQFKTMNSPGTFPGMDVEFKFLPDGEGERLVIKQARPIPQ